MTESEEWVPTDHFLIEVASGLRQLSDPVLFEIIVHNREKIDSRLGIDALPEEPTHYARFKKALPEVMGIKVWAEQVEPEIIKAMAEAMPKGRSEPEALARSALSVFQADLAKTTVARMLALSPLLVDPDDNLKQVHKAAVGLREALAACGRKAHAALFLEIAYQGGSLSDFTEMLDELIEFTQPLEVDSPQKQGRRREPINRVVLVTGNYLVQQGLTRKTAARVLTALLRVHPDLPSKSFDAVYKVVLDSDPSRPGGGEGKAWGPRILVTPSAR